MRRLALALLPLFLTACDSAAVSERTYPTPGPYPAVALSELTAVEAGRYNVEGYVTSISECPLGAMCFVADHFMAAEQRDPTPTSASVMIFANRPSQLHVESFYVFSVEVAGAPGGTRFVTLLGWSGAGRLE